MIKKTLLICSFLSLCALFIPIAQTWKYGGTEETGVFLANSNPIIITMGIAVSFCLELLRDTTYKISIQRNFYFRLRVFIGVIIPSFFGCIYIDISKKENLEYLPVICNIRAITIGYLALYGIYTYGKIWSGKYISFIGFLIASSRITHNFCSYKMINNSILNIFQLCQESILLLLITILCVQWYRNISHKLKWIEDDSFCTCYLIIITVLFFFQTLLNISSANWIRLFSSDIDFYILSEYIFLFTISAVQLFNYHIISIRETVCMVSMTEMEQMLEAKRGFVRYFVHEMRTPLNTTILGLDLLSKHIKDLCLKNHIDGSKCLVMVKDLHLSVSNSVEILNETMVYDKVETSSLTLNKAFFSPLAFVEEAMRPFYIQAQEVGIQLSLLISPNFQNVCRGYLIRADRSKATVVVRNLISNALKFTKNSKQRKVIVSIDCIIDELDVIISDTPIANNKYNTNIIILNYHIIFY